MTRLVEEQIINIPNTLANYDQKLRNKTGFALKDLAVQASGYFETGRSARTVRVAVVPITAGQGMITGFSEAIKAIANHLGFDARLTAHPDIRGLAEAYGSDAELAVMADDFMYIVVNLNSRRVSGNDHATAKGYCFALQSMARGLDGRTVLLIGAGPVGREAAVILAKKKAKPVIYDLDHKRATGLAYQIQSDYGIKAEMITRQAAEAKSWDLIFDASPGEAVVTGAMVNNNTVIAAPGIPLGLNQQALLTVAERLIHDPLQIGTAVMLFEALT